MKFKSTIGITTVDMVISAQLEAAAAADVDVHRQSVHMKCGRRESKYRTA